MEEKYLPLGTVVRLKNATKELVITGYCGINMEKKKMFDYSACIYPEGNLGSNLGLLFNHDQIDRVISVGYSDEKWKKFIEEIKKMTANKTNEQLCEEFLKDMAEKTAEFDKKVAEEQAKQNNTNDSADEGNFGEI